MSALLEQIVPRLYEKRLRRTISGASNSGSRMVNHLILVLNESDLLQKNGIARLRLFADWCDETGVKILTVYISMIGVDNIDSHLASDIERRIHGIFSDADFELFIYSKHSDSRTVKSSNEGALKVNISIGFGGRDELTNAIKNIMKSVKSGESMPEDINAKLIESNLIFDAEPDLIIRSGGKSLTDFLIWQSVYSELYFTDVNWNDFRKIDLLRAIRDYQTRERRYGK